MATVSIVYRKDKLNKKNEAPVNFFVLKDRKLTKVSTGIKVPLDCWDFSKNKVKSKHPNSARMNSLLQNKFTELQDTVFGNETFSKSLTSRQLKEKTFGKKPTNVFEYSKKILDGYLVDGQVGTYDNNKSVMEKLLNFHGSENLTFHEITPDYLAKYEFYLKTKINNKTNTIYKNLKFIKKLFNEAYKEDIIEHNVNPFIKYKLKSVKSLREYLIQEELDKIEAFKAPYGEVIMKHKDMFIFAAYTGGIRVSDMLLLRWKNFDGTHIHFTIKKTGEQKSIKVPNKGLEILNRYKTKKLDKSAFIFSCLPNDLNENNPRELDNAISRGTALINKNLHIIADKINLGKKLSFHVSRHSWACLALKKDISIDKVSKLMGHSSIKVTQIYAKIVSAELDKAMDAFND